MTKKVSLWYNLRVDLVERCLAHDFAFDVFKDPSGSLGVAVFVVDEYHFFPIDDDSSMADVHRMLNGPTRKACFDSRKVYDLGVRPTDVKGLYDIACMFSWEGTVHQLASERLGPSIAEELLEKDRRFSSHIKACKTAKVDMRKNSVLDVVPASFVHSLMKIRTVVIMRLLELAVREGLTGKHDTDTFPLYSRLMEVERNGVRFDSERATEELAVGHPIHIEKWLKGAIATQKDGFLYTMFSPVPTKTGRIRTAGRSGKFNLMGVPHGVPRETLVSRFEGGKIGVVDYNAIDYRCIVASVDDESFRDRYSSYDDFHMANCVSLFGDVSNVTPELRSVVKQLTYMSIYGGSDETLSEKTGLSPKNVKAALDIFSRELEPVHRFRDSLYRMAMVRGYVDLPGGRRVKVDDADHPGKVLGLYAQGYSSMLFEMALIDVLDSLRGKKSVVVFTVHDEIVVDIHPDEADVLSLVKANMEGAAEGLRAKAREGTSYARAV